MVLNEYVLFFKAKLWKYSMGKVYIHNVKCCVILTGKGKRHLVHQNQYYQTLKQESQVVLIARQSVFPVQHMRPLGGIDERGLMMFTVL